MLLKLRILNNFFFATEDEIALQSVTLREVGEKYIADS